MIKTVVNTLKLKLLIRKVKHLQEDLHELELIKDYDLHSLKVVYYDAYKDEKWLITNPSEILLGG